MLAAFASIVFIFYQNLPAISSALSIIPATLILYSTLLVTAGTVSLAVLWTSILRFHTDLPPLRPVSYAFFVGQLGKYIPGGVWAFGAQAVLLAKYGVSPSRTLATSGVLVILLIISSLAVGSASPWIVDVLGSDALSVFLILSLLLLSAVVPRFYFLLMRKRSYALSHPISLSRGISWTALQVAIWLILGMAVALLALPFRNSFTMTFVLLVVSCNSLAFALGAIFVVAPAGLGVRDLTLAGMLAPQIGLSSALAVAILSRVLSIGVDVSLAGVATLGIWRIRFS